ncbi:MOSC domain-containing protein [Nocardioides sp. zg-1230]|uniref:MOSC domain-containing protein n=1 Tax=Nocardioides sp. zg-1230 TaxID=2736601 RepID=UPI001556D56A|nr:MOSC N-terminal beta barrel domain-containing protein [Nocardioides sp. zg-1230]NPC40989.1 MOSC domain-containing protein [Nocardioides sp. zg-1230]
MDELVVRRAGFAPVKGMRHLALDGIDLDEQGAVGDRSFCLVDVDAARVLKTVQHPSLIGVVARAEGDRLGLTLPTGEEASGTAARSGRTVTCDYWGRSVDLDLTEGPHAELVSGWLARRASVAIAPRGGVVFGDPLTVVGTASLRELGRRTGRDEVADQPARFRPTLVVETDEPHVEDSWVGQEVAIGEAVVRIGGPVPRCAVIDHHPETGVKDVRLLKALVRERPTNRAGEPMFGVYARCVVPGRVTISR